MGVSFHGEILHEGREFSMKGALNFHALFKKRSEIKLKKTSSFNWR